MGERLLAPMNQNKQEKKFCNSQLLFKLGQDTGSGIYHPHLYVSHYVNPKGMGITITISRAELAAIAAAVIHGYSHTATDSLPSLHQIKQQLSHWIMLRRSLGWCCLGKVDLLMAGAEHLSWGKKIACLVNMGRNSHHASPLSFHNKKLF